MDGGPFCSFVEVASKEDRCAVRVFTFCKHLFRSNPIATLQIQRWQVILQTNASAEPKYIP